MSPTWIEWKGGGEGVIEIDSDGAATHVRWSAAFPLASSSVSDMLFGVVMRGKMAGMANEESRGGLASKVG